MSARTGQLVAALALVALGTGAALAQSRGGTGTGRYTAEQAAAGAQVYAINCAMCHGARMEGRGEIPPLTGRFVANWAGRPVADLFAYVSRAMPQHAPGSLAPEQNAHLVALLLQANGVPAGARELPADEAALQRITFDPPGPAL
ncbi:c-type cytochrome [Alteraurantiacibacter buctensis]|uniref:C-type cytochrome n=1 Tax=Alteraurantiacibacter buctensis TaxID=1503981 RepID=A0A844YRM7_9SPHN|nr:cytochrome c [Alteraurantiacibacter buctensis]MXO71005.1 c-type cytochrome [Alteraurantiacibacter buctensis]